MNKIRIVLIACFITSVLFAQKKPNVIFILTDDLGYGDLSCCGATKQISTKSAIKFKSQNNNINITTVDVYSEFYEKKIVCR